MLDLGCGWGPLLNFIRSRAATGLGVTLSSAQADACRRHGLDARIEDAREVTRETFGEFDAVASLGAFEHFCSVEDYRAGRQSEIYADLFGNVAGLLPDGGRFYLQTMVFGPNMIDPDEADIDAPARLRRLVPGADAAPVPGLVPALRQGADHRERRAALPARRRRSAAGSTTSRRSASGGGASASPACARRCSRRGSCPRWLTSSDFRLAFTSGVSANSVCFERELLEHYRLTFERLPSPT